MPVESAEDVVAAATGVAANLIVVESAAVCVPTVDITELRLAPTLRLAVAVLVADAVETRAIPLVSAAVTSELAVTAE